MKSRLSPAYAREWFFKNKAVIDERSEIAEVSEKLDNFSDTGINTAISWFFEKKT
jgi:hypothetical protein